MSRGDWFRHQEWSPAIEATFFAQLERARDKAQYLRIQASTIAPLQPRVALALLQRYFDLGENFAIAQAHYDRASAYLALGDVDSAINALEAALDREETHPQVITNAYISLPVLIARERLTERYDQALRLLEKHRERAERALFPVDLFLWNGVRAIVLAEFGSRDKAVQAAGAALKAADANHSGLSRHPTLGLVGNTYADLLRRIKEIALA
jgi:tetratricopeptide (TPR) repeat protein